MSSTPETALGAADKSIASSEKAVVAHMCFENATAAELPKNSI
jgi:hypothetical protein